MIYDVAVIGGGIIGCAIARQLSKYDLKICLLEKGHDVSLGATKANSGMIHGGYNAHRGSLKQVFNIRGNMMYRRLNEELNFGLDWVGSYVIGFNRQDEQTLLTMQDNGQKGGLHTQILAREEVLERNPNLNPVLTRALYCAGSGIIPPYEACVAFAENAVKNGVELVLNCEVKDICPEGNVFRIITVQEELESRIVINAAGIYSDVVAGMVGLRNFMIEPRRGSYLLFGKGTDSLVSGFVFSCPTATGKGVTVSPTYHGNLFIGPDSVRTADKEDRGTDWESLLKIVAQARSLMPSLPFDKLIRAYSGVRASSTVKDFVVEESAVPGFINVAGIESPGLSAAPAIAKYVSMLTRKTGRVKMQQRTDFDPWRASLIERKTKANMRPYGEIRALLKLPTGEEKRIICRCEQVDEKTVLRALKRGIPLRHLEGVKRRVRTGMGFCQGSFCEGRLKKLLSDFYGVPEEEVKGFDWEHKAMQRVPLEKLKENLVLEGGN